MADDVVYGKIATIERCLDRIHEDYVDHEAEFAAFNRAILSLDNPPK